MGQNEPLANFNLIATNRVEEAQFKLSQEITDLQILRVTNRNNFHLRMNGTKIGRMSLLYNRVGTDIKIRSGQPGDSIIFVFGGGVPSTFNLDGKPTVVSPNRAAIIKPSQKIQVDRPKNSQVIVLRASLADLRHHFETMMNRHHRGTILYGDSVKVNSGPGSKVNTLVRNLVYELSKNELVLTNPKLLERYEDMLLTALLKLPHKDRDKIYSKRHYQVAPGIVRRAEEHMHAHLGESITITDLLRTCNCSRSVLFAAFKSARNYSPLEFLTEQRLQKARAKLKKPSSNSSVSSVALDCGFIHMGRFSRVYKRRFGESPSETLQKGRWK